MAQQRTNNLRLAGLLAFVAVMPLLAVPAVNERLDAWFFRGEVSVGGPFIEPAKTAAKFQKSSDIPPDSPASVIDSGVDIAVGETGATEGIDRLPPIEAAVNTDEFNALQKRLQDLGAAYFRLEDIGSSEARYRFHCEVPLPGNSTYQRPFEQEDRDPIRAMERVVAEVEVWCAAQRTKRMAKATAKETPRSE